MKTTWLKSTLALTIGALSGQVLANGFAINEQSVSTAGTAYAGRASTPIDASTLYGNPAGLSKLKRTEVSGGLALVAAKDDISDAQGGSRSSTGAFGTSKGDSVPLSAVPFGYFSTPLDDKVTFGLGIYAPYGIVNDYESSFAGRSHGSNSRIRVITIQPTLAYKFNDRVSVGFGPTINRIDGQLDSDLNTAVIPAALGGNGGDTAIRIKGDDVATGFNLGVMVDLSDDTTWGATYHSRVKYELEGDTKIRNAPPALGGDLLSGKYDAQLDVTLPESVDTSITHRLDDRWTLYAGATWTRWSRLQSIEVQNSGLLPPFQGNFGTLSEELNWKDTWSGAIGASYQLDKQWVLRTGFAYDPSPTSNADRTVRIPVGDRKVFTLGAGYSPNDDLTIDVAYGYLWENTAGVNHPAGDNPLLQPAYHAKYDNTAHILGTQLTYRF